MSDKVQVVRNYFDLLNEGKHSQASAHVSSTVSASHSSLTSSFLGGPTSAQLSKTDAISAQNELLKVIDYKTVISDVKEVDGKVVVVGKSLVKLKVEEVPFKAVYEFDGAKISGVEFETDPNFKVQAFSI